MPRRPPRLPLSYVGKENARPILFYDLSIENMEERRANVKRFDCIKDAATFSGWSHQTIGRHVGKRIVAGDGKTYAVREPKKDARTVGPPACASTPPPPPGGY